MIALISARGGRWILSVLMTAAASGHPLLARQPAATDADSVGQVKLRALDLADFRGRQWTLQDFSDQSLLVVAFLGTECPLAKLYSVRLQKLQQQYQARGVQVIAVMSNRQDSLEEIAAFARRQKLSFPVLKDPGNRFADQVGAERTPEILVYDATRTLRYRGRIDDQYGIGYVRDQPRRQDLKVAVDELLSCRDVSLDRTAAVGCIIGRPKSIADPTEITFGNQVAEILNRRCVDCHREGEIAPFSLSDYDEVAGWADMIAEVVRDGRMPPWHAAEQTAEDQQSTDGQNAVSMRSKFMNNRSMPEKEKEILYQWAEAGAPAGDLTGLPSLPDKVEGWQLPREPDQVIEINPEPFQVPAAGAVQYQYFTVDPGFEDDIWIESMELKPGNRLVVHHILVFDHPPGQRGDRGGGALGFLAGYVPGSRLAPYPPGYAKKFPAGNLLTFQVHYTPVGTPQTDQIQFGLVFADPAEITHEIATMSAVQPQLKIPPGESAYETYSQSPRLPERAELLSFSPHMHF